MITYLTKTEKGKIHHFRVSVKGNELEIVNGIFYNWLAKYWQECKSFESAKAKHDELIEEKLKEGFILSEFRELPENTIDIYDKAEWHVEQNFPNDLDDFQSYVHTGMFLAWLIDTDLVSDEFKSEHRSEIEQFKNQKITGTQIFQECCDGVLMLNELNELGNKFALPYFSIVSRQYISDYSKVLAKDLPSFYYVKDTWENYKKLKAVLDITFREWKSNHSN